VDIAVFFGAFLGFVSGIALLAIGTWWRRSEQAASFRCVAALEVLDNLEAMEEILESIDHTESNGYAVAETAMSRPRTDVLRAVGSNPDLMLSLSDDERINIPQSVSHIDRVLAEYAKWPSALGGVTGAIMVRLPDGTNLPQREVATRQLRDTLRTVMTGQIVLLVVLVNRSRRERLRPRHPLQAIYDALQPTRKGKSAERAVQAALRPPIGGVGADTSRPLVVWWNGSSYPGTVIVLTEHVR